jgi:hypothetical protein
MLESPHGRRGSTYPVSALRGRNGAAGPGSRQAVDARSVLGLRPLRPAFLVHLRDAQRGKAQAGSGTGILTPMPSPSRFHLDDDPDEDDEDDDDPDEDDDDSDDDEDEDEDVETWQVRPPAASR